MNTVKCPSSSIWSRDGTLVIVTTLGQSRPGSYCNEGVLHIPQISKTRTLPSDAVLCFTQDTNSIWFINETLTSPTTLGQSGPGSNHNEEVSPYFPKLQNWSLTIKWFSDISRTLVWWGSYSQIQSVYLFYCHTQLGYKDMDGKSNYNTLNKSFSLFKI